MSEIASDLNIFDLLGESAEPKTVAELAETTEAAPVLLGMLHGRAGAILL